MPPLDLHESVRAILARGASLPPEADSPVAHFNLAVATIGKTLAFVERTALKAGSPAESEEHLGQIRQMALVSLIETLERFLKEAAGECVNLLAPVTADDRFDTFRVHGSALAGHFGAGTLGRALCESETWLNCTAINTRFRDLLADASAVAPPLQPFHLFPNQPTAERTHFDTLQLIWQLRHTVVHNVGVVTQSDAVKLRVLAKRPVEAPRAIVPTGDDVRHLVQYLRETVARCAERIAGRLADVLARIASDAPDLIDAPATAQRVARAFRCRVTVGSATAEAPP